MHKIMEEQTNSQPARRDKNFKSIWAIVISVTVIALLVGGGVYLWQQSNLKLTEEKLQQQITQLQDQINQLQQVRRSEQRPETKYNLYGQGLYKEGVQKIESRFIKKTDIAPKEFVVDGERMVVKQINVEKNKLSPDESFSVYLIVSYKNKDEKIGFWYADTNAKDDKDGCAGTSTCGGVLSIETKRWTTAPEVKEAISTLFIKSIALIDIDYDFNTNDWNFIEIGSQLYKEHQYPPRLY